MRASDINLVAFGDRRIFVLELDGIIFFMYNIALDSSHGIGDRQEIFPIR